MKFIAKFMNTPDITWVSMEKNCIRLYAVNEYNIQPGELVTIVFNDWSYEMENVVGVPYIPHNENVHNLALYHPKGSFKLDGSGIMKVSVLNNKNHSIHITPGDFIACIKLMSIQFYNLWKKSNNSDLGLRSVPIKIELKHEKS